MVFVVSVYVVGCGGLVLCGVVGVVVGCLGWWCVCWGGCWVWGWCGLLWWGWFGVSACVLWFWWWLCLGGVGCG
ncbi:hypothetical protein, partial [Pseudomonas syringae group genomosp. 7]|uniref:hypothetical protein n=1 Tax=Pseudomonas syringae group genomosp. 7 TaxID=251699 RepID=UPI00377070E4